MRIHVVKYPKLMKPDNICKYVTQVADELRTQDPDTKIIALPEDWDMLLDVSVESLKEFRSRLDVIIQEKEDASRGNI